MESPDSLAASAERRARTPEFLTIEFLPDGAPSSDELDRIGAVVATQWSQAPVYVLAEAVSLRAAWRALFESWPTCPSAAVSALTVVRH